MWFLWLQVLSAHFYVVLIHFSIIITIIIRYHLYAGYLPETTHVSRVWFCSYSLFTVYVTGNIIFHVKCFVLLLQYFPKYV